MRIISAAQTKQQIIAETKTVTRRLGWLNLKVGELLQVVEKAQGLKKGEKMKRLKVIRVTEVHREPLNAITQAEVVAEGFPDMTPDEFIAFFCKGHKKCTPTTEVTVIHFEYVRLCDFCDTGIAEWEIKWGNGGEIQWACQNCTENENEMIGIRCKECDLYFQDYEMEDKNFDRDIDWLFTCDKCIEEQSLPEGATLQEFKEMQSALHLELAESTGEDEDEGWFIYSDMFRTPQFYHNIFSTCEDADSVWSWWVSKGKMIHQQTKELSCQTKA